MSLINQLKDGPSKDFAKYCYEKFRVDELRSAVEGSADEAEMKRWDITEGEWHEAVAAALADLEIEKHPPSE
jgi:hypothetical protein